MAGSFQTGNSSSKVKDKTPREFKQQRGFVADLLNSRARGDVEGIEGPFAAPVSFGELSSLEALRRDTFDPGGRGAQIDDFISGRLNQKQNPFLQETINAAIRPLIQDAQLKELQSRAAFTGAGQKLQTSSAFGEDRARAVDNVEQTIANVASQIAFQEFETRQRQQIEVATLANSRFQEQREAISALALPRLVEQFGIDKGNEELQRRYAMIDQALTTLASLTSATPVTESKAFNFGTSGGKSGGGSGATGDA